MDEDKIKKITVENMKEYLRLKKLEKEDEHDELVNEVFDEIIEKNKDNFIKF